MANKPLQRAVRQLPGIAVRIASPQVAALVEGALQSGARGKFQMVAALLVLTSATAGSGWLFGAPTTPPPAPPGVQGQAAEKAEQPIPADQFERLHRLIKPQPGESRWATIPWLTDLQEARRRAATEDRPLFVWRAGGGEVLGRA